MWRGERWWRSIQDLAAVDLEAFLSAFFFGFERTLRPTTVGVRAGLPLAPLYRGVQRACWDRCVDSGQPFKRRAVCSCPPRLKVRVDSGLSRILPGVCADSEGAAGRAWSSTRSGASGLLSCVVTADLSAGPSPRGPGLTP